MLYHKLVSCEFLFAVFRKVRVCMTPSVCSIKYFVSVSICRQQMFSSSVPCFPLSGTSARMRSSPLQPCSQSTMPSSTAQRTRSCMRTPPDRISSPLAGTTWLCWMSSTSGRRRTSPASGATRTLCSIAPWRERVTFVTNWRVFWTAWRLLSCLTKVTLLPSGR